MCIPFVIVFIVFPLYCLITVVYVMYDLLPNVN